MRPVVILAVLLLLIPILAGCASTSKAAPAQSDAAKTIQTEPGKGLVFLYRRGRMVGAALSTQIKINGVDAGGTGPGTFFRWDLAPGKYVFSASSQESSAAVEVNVEEGGVYYVEQIERLGVQSGRVQLVARDRATGEREVTGLKLLVSTYVPQ